MIPSSAATGATPDLLRELVGEERAVCAAYATNAGEYLGLDPTVPWTLRSFRLYPIKNERFVIGYRFAQADDPIGGTALYHAYARRHDPGDEPESGELRIPELRQFAFVPRTDARFAVLDRVLNGDHLRDLGIPVRGPGSIVAYRPQGRVTIRFASSDGDSIWLRASASATRAARVSALASIGASLEIDGGKFPQVLRRIDSLNATWIENCPGKPFSERIAEVDESGIERVARALVGLSKASTLGLSPHHAVDEAQQTAIALRRAVRILPSQLAGIESDLVALFDATLDADAPRLSPIHRDLHDKQIVWSDDSDGPVCFLDSDTLAAGDPALDLANLAVHLELREIQGLIPRTRGAGVAQRLIDACARSGLAIQRARLDYYSACSWLRLAGVYALRSHGMNLVPTLLSMGRNVLSRL